jgi:hypothetical protein
VQQRQLQRSANGGSQHNPALQRFAAIIGVVDEYLAGLERGSRSNDESSASEPDEVVTFEWSAPTPPRRARDFSSADALYSWLIVSD